MTEFKNKILENLFSVNIDKITVHVFVIFNI